MAGQTLLSDPKECFTGVRCPVLASFSEDDLLQLEEEYARLGWVEDRPVSTGAGADAPALSSSQSRSETCSNVRFM